MRRHSIDRVLTFSAELITGPESAFPAANTVVAVINVHTCNGKQIYGVYLNFARPPHRRGCATVLYKF